MQPPDSARCTEIAERTLSYFRGHQRDLPWRRTRDPYAIWVSEIMLQQTRVTTVIPFFQRWLRAFPTVTALANADIDDVLALWTGLGYYSRARNLHRGAKELVADYASTLPSCPTRLRTLPGIGPYTAGAIASIAFQQQAALVDGNVARVFSRLYAIAEDIKSPRTMRVLWSLAEQHVPADAPGDFNQGLMELGATVCTPTQPSCDSCPLASLCAAHQLGKVDSYPRKRPPKSAAQLPLIDRIALWVVANGSGKVLLLRRKPSGLYGGLWELPQRSLRAGQRSADAWGLFGNKLHVAASKPVAEHKSVLSHRRLRIRVWPGTITGRYAKSDLAAFDSELEPSPYDQHMWQPLDSIGERGISAATVAIIAQYTEHGTWIRKKPRHSSLKKATTRSSPG